MIKQFNSGAFKGRFSRSSSERGAALAGLLGFGAAVIAVVSLVFFMFGRIVPPGYVGIRHNGWTLQK